MNADGTERSSNADADLEREMAGAGALKGASPATHKEQAKAEIGNCLRSRLIDPAGAPGPVLVPDYMPRGLVREADFEWGRMHGERPHPDDPYTAESVRVSLSRLGEMLAAGDV